MGMKALFLVLTIAALRVAPAVAGSPAALPKDPCAILKISEIQALAPNAQISDGVSNTELVELGSVACEYEWGAGNNVASGRFYLSISFSDGSRTFPGMSSELIKAGLLASVKAGDAHAAVIPGVGEAAIFMSDDPIRATTSAYVKGILLQVNFECSDARAKKDQVIALLKSAAARL